MTKQIYKELYHEAVNLVIYIRSYKQRLCHTFLSLVILFLLLVIVRYGQKRTKTKKNCKVIVLLRLRILTLWFLHSFFNSHLLRVTDVSAVLSENRLWMCIYSLVLNIYRGIFTGFRRGELKRLIAQSHFGYKLLFLSKIATCLSVYKKIKITRKKYLRSEICNPLRKKRQHQILNTSKYKIDFCRNRVVPFKLSPMNDGLVYRDV